MLGLVTGQGRPLVTSMIASLVFALALAAPAGAWQHKGAPEYSLSVVEGATTQPEDSIEGVSGKVESEDSEAEVAVSILHNGLIVDKQSDKGSVWLSQVPQVGDTLTYESTTGFKTQVVYDGLPSMEPTVCAGSTDFSGQRTLGYTIEGGYYTVVPHPRYFARRNGGLAQVQVLAGSSFGGDFLVPLATGETVYAVESLVSPLAGGATFTYSSEYDRPVGGCPPPPPPPPPPVPLALSGTLASVGHPSIRKLLRSGLATRVTINQAGTIVEDLYLRGGALPAFATSRHGPKHKRRHGRPAALLLARGTASAGGAGTFAVVMHVTPRGLALLKHAHSVKVVLITTLTANSGAKLALARHFLTLRR